MLNSLQWKTLAPSYPLLTVQAELMTLDTIYTSYKPLILTATQLWRREPSFNGMSPLIKWKRSLLPFLGDALSWLNRTATAGNVRDIKRRVNQLIKIQTHQQEMWVQVTSILTITRYTMQVNRQHINKVMQAVQRTHNDITTLFNIMSLIYTCINYQQILVHVHSILANLRDSLYYMRQIACSGLHRCRHYQYIITTCTFSRRIERHTEAHQSRVTINNALTSVIGWHSSLLYILAHPCFSDRGTISTTDWCTYSGLHTMTWDLPSLHTYSYHEATCQHDTT